MNKKGVRTSAFQPELPEETNLPEELDMVALKCEFERDFERESKLSIPFHKKMEAIFADLKVSKAVFEERTLLGRNFYNNFLREGYIPAMNSFVSVCMGLGLPLYTANTLLASLNLKFDPHNRTHHAYQYLLTKFPCLTILECNQVLIALGIEEADAMLGSKEKRNSEDIKDELTSMMKK